MNKYIITCTDFTYYKNYKTIYNFLLKNDDLDLVKPILLYKEENLNHLFFSKKRIKNIFLNKSLLFHENFNIAYHEIKSNNIIDQKLEINKIIQEINLLTEII